MLQISWAGLGAVMAVLTFIYGVLHKTIRKKDDTSGVIQTFQKFLDNLMEQQRETIVVQRETSASLRSLVKITERSHEKLDVTQGVVEHTNGIVIDNKKAIETVEGKVDEVRLSMAELKGSKRK